MCRRLFGPFATPDRLFDLNFYSGEYYSPCMGQVNHSAASMRWCRLFNLTREAIQQQLRWSLMRIVSSQSRAAAAFALAIPTKTRTQMRRLHERLAFTTDGDRRKKLQMALRGMDGVLENLTLKNVECYLFHVSVVRFYERDVYMSIGAYAHVVLQMQSKREDLNMNTNYFAMSFFDNLGFLLHGELGPGGLSGKEAKYTYRCLDAALKFGVDLAAGGAHARSLYIATRRFVECKQSGDLECKDKVLKSLPSSSIALDMLLRLHKALIHVTLTGVAPRMHRAHISSWNGVTVPVSGRAGFSIVG
jgi:hypothetical protein